MAEHHDEPPHQAPWVFYVTVGSVVLFMSVFLLIKFTVAA